jgi:dynein heavy chain
MKYFRLLEDFERLYVHKYEKLDQQERNYTGGIERIEEASQKITGMKANLGREEKELKKKTDRCQAILANLSLEQSKSEEIEKEVALTTSECERKTKTILEATRSAEKDYEEAQPALQRAKEAVEGIRKQDIDEVKNFTHIPMMLEYIMDTVGILFQARLSPVAPTRVRITTSLEVTFINSSIEFTKPILNDSKFIDKLRNFDRDTLNEETIELLEPYVRQPWFMDGTVDRVSNAAKGILKWVQAIMEYYEKKQIVIPKEKKLIIEK